MAKLIGRQAEIEEMMCRYHSGNPEFIVVYGRRRVGKTFLIKELFQNQFAFQHTGLSPVDKNKKVTKTDQLKSFYFSLLQYGLEDSACPKDWIEAFFLLEQLLGRKSNGQRQVVFIDELPWLDTPRSGFMSAFEGFWNGWANYHDEIFLVVCGSATSWISDKLIMAKGGLYGRLTDKIKLSPFTLKECDEFYKSRNIKLQAYDVVEGYMAMGGIPYYMDYFMPGLSLSQNIDRLFFTKNAKLQNEFNQLFGSIFTNADDMKRIVRFLGKRHAGYTRNEIAKALDIGSGGYLSDQLKSLEESDFVTRYVPFGVSARCEHYKLCDNFCWFWLHFKDDNAKLSEDFWQVNHSKPSLNSWRGIAFEEVCFGHVAQIKQALGIAGVTTKVSSYIAKGDKNAEGMQIDMLIDRDDRVINLCEMKFVKGQFVVDDNYRRKVDGRVQTVMDLTSKNIHSTLITTDGLHYNEYSGTFQKTVTIDALFNLT